MCGLVASTESGWTDRTFHHGGAANPTETLASVSACISSKESTTPRTRVAEKSLSSSVNLHSHISWVAGFALLPNLIPLFFCLVWLVSKLFSSSVYIHQLFISLYSLWSCVWMGIKLLFFICTLDFSLLLQSQNSLHENVQCRTNDLFHPSEPLLVRTMKHQMKVWVVKDRWASEC